MPSYTRPAATFFQDPASSVTSRLRCLLSLRYHVLDRQQPTFTPDQGEPLRSEAIAGERQSMLEPLVLVGKELGPELLPHYRGRGSSSRGRFGLHDGDYRRGTLESPQQQDAVAHLLRQPQSRCVQLTRACY